MNICDLVITIDVKDCDNIEKRIDNFRQFTGIKTCYIITNASLKFSDSDIIVVDEKDLKIPDISFFNSLPYKVPNRGGWLFQQFCKLCICENISNISENP